jgi:putative endonuclease
MAAGKRASVRVGRTGEELAVAYLADRGYSILARNQRTPLGELDVVCGHGDSIIVVEVKSRSSNRFGEGLEAIDPGKARRLRAAAAWWLADRHVSHRPVRFDAVIVSLGKGEPQSLKHVKSIIGLGE